jgi:hypothetical protein
LVQRELEEDLRNREDENKQLNAELEIAREKEGQTTVATGIQQTTVTLLEMEYKSSVEGLEKQVAVMKGGIIVSKKGSMHTKVAYLVQNDRARELKLKEQLARELEHVAEVEDIFTRYEEYNEGWEEKLEEQENENKQLRAELGILKEEEEKLRREEDSLRKRNVSRLPRIY